MDIDIVKHKKLIKKLWDTTNNLPIDSDERSRLGAGCLQLAQDHHAGILFLVETTLYSSAFALLRTQYESLIRGLWILKVASNKQLEEYKKNQRVSSINEALDALLAASNYEKDSFRAIKKSLKLMHSFTHSGFLANLNHQDSNSIQPNYKINEILNLIKFSNFFGIWASIEVLHLSKKDNTELISLLETIYSEITDSQIDSVQTDNLITADLDD